MWESNISNDGQQVGSAVPQRRPRDAALSFCGRECFAGQFKFATKQSSCRARLGEAISGDERDWRTFGRHALVQI